MKAFEAFNQIFWDLLIILFIHYSVNIASRWKQIIKFLLFFFLAAKVTQKKWRTATSKTSKILTKLGQNI